MHYTIESTQTHTDPSSPFSINWTRITPLSICNFHHKSSDHHPIVHAQLAYDPNALYLHFTVHDRYIRCIQTDYQQPVCTDSCVEAFIEPVAGKGYFNFEINATGALLTYYIEDPRKTPNGFARYTQLPVDLLQQVQIHTSLRGPITQEITTPTDWQLTARIPLSLMAHFTGPISTAPGAHWRGNFYKCGDHTSHPHWASWNPIGEELNFHQPATFGDLVIA